MSITSELREWVSVVAPYKYGHQLLAIADRIDAEHQKALNEWAVNHGQMWQKGYSRCRDELMDGNDTLAADLEECGWIRLPKDADGEYIRIGDVMESRNGYNLFPQFEVRAMRYDGDEWEVIDRHEDRCDPSGLRHHHAPTVEDALREFASEFVGCANCVDDHEVTDAIAEYAPKFRMAGDGE